MHHLFLLALVKTAGIVPPEHRHLWRHSAFEELRSWLMTAVARGS
jgi:hypothetical protein